MKIRVIIILLIILAGFFGCKTKKVISDSNILPPLDKDVLIGQLEDNSQNIDNIFFRRSLVQFSSDEISHTFRSNIYINRNSVIRISILAPMGIEVARVSMEPDSVTIIDRMNREVIYADYNEIYRKFGIEGDYHLFQSLLLNEAFSMFQNKGISLHNYHMGIDKQQYKLSSVRERSGSLFNSNSDGFFHKMWIEPKSYEVTRFSFNEQKKNMVLDILYTNFIELSEGQKFPEEISITGNRGLKKVSVDISHSDIQVNGADKILFQVSDRYEKIFR